MRLDKSFYLKDAVTVAKELLGKHLIRNINGKEVICKIVETEAYCGPEDKGCHAYNNKRTNRTEVMFHEGGCAYVYLIYGMYNCLNVVSNLEGLPEAVLIRAVEPLNGVDVIRSYRKIKSNKEKDLTNGPGKLCQALYIDKRFTGYDLVNGEELFLANGEEKGSTLDIVESRRINIDYAEEYVDKLWRFYIKDNPYVSVK